MRMVMSAWNTRTHAWANMAKLTWNKCRATLPDGSALQTAASVKV